jgi:uncharacterized protein YbjT (DUF2867 family)
MYVVFGVTGNTGKIVAETLLDQREPVRIVVRDMEQGAHWAARGAEVAVASLEDAAALERALKGASGAYVLLPTSYTSGDNLGENRRRIAALAKAIPASGVKHVVLLSSIGAQHAAGTGPIQWLHEAEQRFASLGVKATFLRAPYFAENWGASLAPVVHDGVLYAMFEDRIPMVAARDVGQAAAKLLVEGPGPTRIVNLHPPAKQGPADVAAIFAKLLGRAVKVVVVPPEQRQGALLRAGLTEDAARLLVEMNAGIPRGLFVFEEAGARHEKASTSLETALRRLVVREW